MVKFTIITICYDAEESIGKTVESVLKQTNTEYEYIIIDGASTDETLSILKNYQNPNMKIYSEPDQGISDAFNKGVIHSCGKYLLFLNSGDYFLNNDVLEEVSRSMVNSSEEVITFSIKGMLTDTLPDCESTGKRLWEESLIPHQGSFIKREVFAKVGMFNKTFKIRMDYDFFCRCYREGISFKCIPKCIVYMDSNGVSATDEYNFQREGLAIRLLYGKRVQAEELRVMQYLTGHDGMTVSEMQEKLEIQRRSLGKYYKIMIAMYRWIRALQNGKDSSQFFLGKAVYHIGIYGWGYLGKCLAHGLQGTSVKVEFVIDQNKKGEFFGGRIYNWEDTWPKVDMIVVTPFYEFTNIKKKIKNKIRCKVVSIEDVITGI